MTSLDSDREESGQPITRVREGPAPSGCRTFFYLSRRDTYLKSGRSRLANRQSELRCEKLVVIAPLFPLQSANSSPRSQRVAGFVSDRIIRPGFLPA